MEFLNIIVEYLKRNPIIVGILLIWALAMLSIVAELMRAPEEKDNDNNKTA